MKNFRRYQEIVLRRMNSGTKNWTDLLEFLSVHSSTQVNRPEYIVITRICFEIDQRTYRSKSSVFCIDFSLKISYIPNFNSIPWCRINKKLFFDDGMTNRQTQERADRALWKVLCLQFALLLISVPNLNYIGHSILDILRKNLQISGKKNFVILKLMKFWPILSLSL